MGDKKPAKIPSKKIRRITLVVIITLLVVAILFVLRAHYISKFGIFASTEGEEQVAFTVDLANTDLSTLTVDNVTKDTTSDKPSIILTDPTKGGSVEGTAQNTNKDSLTSVALNVGLPTGCAASNAVLKVKLCNSSGCGDWFLSTSAAPNRVQLPTTIANVDSIIYHIDLTPCTPAGGGS